MPEFEGMYDVRVDIDEDHLKEYVLGNYNPDEIFLVEQLEHWARNNDWIKKEEDDE